MPVTKAAMDIPQALIFEESLAIIAAHSLHASVTVFWEFDVTATGYLNIRIWKTTDAP